MVTGVADGSSMEGLVSDSLLPLHKWRSNEDEYMLRMPLPSDVVVNISCHGDCKVSCS